MKKILFVLFTTLFVCFQLEAENQATSLLYNRMLSDREPIPELLIADNAAIKYMPEGLEIRDKENLVKLDKYYSLAERTIRYHVKLSEDATAVFQSDTKDFTVLVNMIDKTITIATSPMIWKRSDFLDPNHEYLVEISRSYQHNKVRVVDLFTGQAEVLEAVQNGSGGHGVGTVQSGFNAGYQHDYYCFGLQEGTSLLVRQINVIAGGCDYLLLLYGDSITEPEGYFPTQDFLQSWTQLIIHENKGKVICSGRGGCQINEVLKRIKNELPYIKSKYVMVTIGTNGGNTEENLSELVEYIMAQGSIPILNNIPSNESGTQIKENQLIEKVRQKYDIKGCKFDLATSLNQDGKEVDKTTMYYEDYTDSYGWHIYHHPNVKGSRLMYIRTLIDTPEIYE